MSEREYDVVCALRILEARQEAPPRFFEAEPMFKCAIEKFAAAGYEAGSYLRQYEALRQRAITINSQPR